MSAHALSYQTPAAARGAGLQPVRHRANWRGDKVKLPHYLIPGFGARIEEVATHLAAHLANKYGPELRLGWAAESTNVPGQSRPIRVTRTVAPGHLAVCDINLYSTGGDLSVRVDSLPRTRIVWLRFFLYTATFLLLFLLGYALFLGGTDQYEFLARDYAHKFAVDGNDVIIYERIMGAMGTPRWTYLDFFRRDPSTFLLSVGKVPFLLAAGIGGLLMLIPADWFRFACDWVGYPRPDRFRAAVNTHNTAVANAMDEMLLARYGIDRSSTRPIDHAG